MHPFLLYVIVSTVCLSICYLVYLLLFRHESGFVHLRSFLVISMFISVLIPLAPFRIQNTILYHPKTVSEQASPNVLGGMQADQNISFDVRKSADTKESQMNLKTILCLIYVVTASFFLLGIVMQIIKIITLYLSSERRMQEGIMLVTSHKIKTPFSFFSWIFLPKNICNADDINKILAHERIHAEEYHSLDLLLANLICGFMWFNPLAWRMKYSVQQVHEYIADEGALRTGIERKDYMALMLNQASEAQLIPLHSNFNHSLIQKRLQMITRGSSYRQSRFKILVLIPIIILFTLLAACVNGNKRKLIPAEESGNTMVLAVENEKMNVIYLGVGNPVRIAASGVNPNDLTVSIDNGRISKVGDNYMIYPAQSGTATVSIYSKGQKLGNRKFRVKELALPQAYLVSGEKLISGGYVSLADLRGAKGILVQIPDFIFDINFEVVSYTINIEESGGITLVLKSENEIFTDPQTDLIESLKPGQTLVIDGIRAIGPDGNTRDLDPLVFKISG